MDASEQLEIIKLSKLHQYDSFDCGKRWLNDYIHQHALNNEETGYGRTYVMVAAGSLTVIGFFTISMSNVVFQNLPEALVYDRIPKYPMPVAHLGCLAIDIQYQNQGLGNLLLIDAFRRIVNAADLVAARALEVKAIDDAAQQWYLKKGFSPFKDHKNHLYIPIETIRKLLE